METKLKAEEILRYCMEYLGNGEIPKNFGESKKDKGMIKEIEFIIDND